MFQCSNSNNVFTKTSGSFSSVLLQCQVILSVILKLFKNVFVPFDANKMKNKCVNKLARRSAVWPIRQNFLQVVPEMYFKLQVHLSVLISVLCLTVILTVIFRIQAVVFRLPQTIISLASESLFVCSSLLIYCTSCSAQYSTR